MKKVLTAIWKFINSRVFLFIIVGVLIVLFSGTCGRNSRLKEESERQVQNISAMTDTIRTIKLANGELQSSKNAFMASAKELEKLNSDLAAEVKAQKGKVVTLNRIVFQLKQDTADLQAYINELLTKYETPVKVNDSTWNVDWTLAFTYDSANFDIFNGRTVVGLRGPIAYLPQISLTQNKTFLLNRQSQMSLTWGQKWEDGRLKVYAQTSHPAFQTKLLEGTYVDFPKKKHWFTGFGIGPSINLGYDFLNQKPAIVAGIGIQYNIYQW
jgi:hypothetical protein